MLAYGNVERFLADERTKGNWYVNEVRNGKILARAWGLADEYGILGGADIPAVFGPGGEEQILMAGFRSALGSEAQHMLIIAETASRREAAQAKS